MIELNLEYSGLPRRDFAVIENTINCTSDIEDRYMQAIDMIAVVDGDDRQRKAFVEEVAAKFSFAVCVVTDAAQKVSLFNAISQASPAKITEFLIEISEYDDALDRENFTRFLAEVTERSFENLFDVVEALHAMDVEASTPVMDASEAFEHSFDIEDQAQAIH